MLAFSLLFLLAATRTWEQSRFEDFDKGAADHVAVHSDGKLSLAPRWTEVFDAPVAHLWALARDSKGVLYAAGGPGARVFRIPPGGAGASFFETEDRKSTRLNSSHIQKSRMPSSA